MNKQKLFIVGVFISWLLIGNAQASNQAEFEQWLQQESQSFQTYRDKRDKEFSQFLKNQWHEMQVFQGLVRDRTPKPRTIPVVKAEPVKSPVVSVVPDRPVPKLVIKKIPDIKKPVTDIKPVPEIALPAGKRIRLNFYGHNLALSFDPALKIPVPARINESVMAQYWSRLSLSDYEPLIKQLQTYRNMMVLNDWAYVLFIHEVSKQIYAGDNERTLFTWFILLKENYSARIAFDSWQVYLLLSSEQPLYAMPYFSFNQRRYYAVNFGGSEKKPANVFTYDGQYPGADKALDMRLRKPVIMNGTKISKKLKFNYQGKEYFIETHYDQNRVNFFSTYPQMDIAQYYIAAVDLETGNQILQQLRSMLEGRSEEDAVNLLLRFVQTAFAYKTDAGQFGRENYLFVEETLHYPYSDCEDRSVFFAWLVRNLLGLEVVGLDYPGHIAAAVRFNQPIKGDAISYNNNSYVIADPTYINARAGMTMPSYRNVQPKVISIIY